MGGRSPYCWVLFTLCQRLLITSNNLLNSAQILEAGDNESTDQHPIALFAFTLLARIYSVHKLSDTVLAWLHVCSEVQMTYMWSS